LVSEWGTPAILRALASLDDAALPNDFVDVRTTEYRLLRYPDRVLSPTLPAAQVVWTQVVRPLDTVFAEVASRVHGWTLDAVHWWVSSGTRPLDTEKYLQARGGIVSDSYQVLARELGRNIIEPALSPEIKVELVRNEQMLRDAIAVETKGWSRTSPGEQVIGERLRETLQNLEASIEFHFLAYVGGQPASTGYCKVNDEVGRLYGAVTLPEFRSRGCYQALLSSRLRQARDVGATIAITRARPLTSGRTLQRAGFEVHDLETCYRMSIA
jgi:GNAT superfamily N-acetyltransferase